MNDFNDYIQKWLIYFSAGKVGTEDSRGRRELCDRCNYLPHFWSVRQLLWPFPQFFQAQHRNNRAEISCYESGSHTSCTIITQTQFLENEVKNICVKPLPPPPKHEQSQSVFFFPARSASWVFICMVISRWKQINSMTYKWKWERKKQHCHA